MPTREMPGAISFRISNIFPNAERRDPDSKKWVQTVRSELVYRFNWGGPVVAKY